MKPKASKKSTEETKLLTVRQAVADMGRLLLQKQLLAGTWGNISVRIDKDCYAITPSGAPYATMQAEDVVLINAKGEKVTGERTPSSETPLHVAIYKNLEAAQAIIHTHSIYASVLATARKDLPPIIEDLLQICGGSVCCAAYALPGTKELAKNVLKALGDKKAALMANHGLVCWGRDLQEALLTAEITEKAAQIYCIAASMGGAVQLSDEDVKVMHDFYEAHYAKRQRGDER